MQYLERPPTHPSLAGLLGLAPRRRRRVLILMSDTGGGHRASAEAIKAGFRERYGDEFDVREGRGGGGGSG